MKTFFLTTIILLTLSVFSSAQNKSVYTSTSDKVCKQQQAADDEGGDYVGICPGVGGYKLKLIEGDLRQTLTVITPKKKEHPLRFNEFYYTFSAIGDKVEWRLKHGVPVALIARYNVSDAENSEKRTSYLMVVKITKSFSCVTEVVPPEAKQNERARKLADAASTKACKVGE